MESKYYHLTGGTHSFLVLHDLLKPVRGVSHSYTIGLGTYLHYQRLRHIRYRRPIATFHER